MQTISGVDKPLYINKNIIQRLTVPSKSNRQKTQFTLRT